MGSPGDMALWRVEVRVPAADWARPGAGRGLVDLEVDLDPPSSGPEVELSFTVGALSAEAALLRVRAMMASRDLTVLAMRGRERGQEEWVA